MADEPRIEELDKLIAKGKQKGFLTYDEVNDALPSDVVSLDQLDDIMLLFGSMDIELVDSTKSVRLPSEIEAPAEVDAELRELQREAEAVRDLAVARPEPEAGGKAG